MTTGSSAPTVETQDPRAQNLWPTSSATLWATFRASQIARFIRAAFGLKSPFSPQGKEYYETKVSNEIASIFSIMNTDRQRHSLLKNFFEQRDISRRPMTSLRDVDKPGQIVPSRLEVRLSRTIPDDALLEVMRFIRSGSGAAVDDSDREGE